MWCMTGTTIDITMFVQWQILNTCMLDIHTHLVIVGREYFPRIFNRTIMTAKAHFFCGDPGW